MVWDTLFKFDEGTVAGKGPHGRQFVISQIKKESRAEVCPAKVKVNMLSMRRHVSTDVQTETEGTDSSPFFPRSRDNHSPMYRL